MANQMTIVTETGEKKTINILDIIDSYAFNKSFIIYNLVEDTDKLYASIINETDTSLTFDAIKDPNEIEYITAEIHRVANELIKEM